MYEKHFTESGSKTKMQKLSVTAGISFLMVEALAISNLIESVRPVTENPSTITVMHCIGWFCMTMYYVRIIFGKTEVNFISEIAKPLSIIVMCIWACYYPHSTESLYIAGASA